MTPSQTQALPSFTEEEVKAAKATRDQLVKERIPEIQSIYMAGEICMWDEMQPILAAKQAELDRLSGWKREAMVVYGPLLDYGQNEMGLKPGESIVTKAIERLKEYSNLKSQLQESKAEVERLKYMIDKGLTWEDMNRLSVPKKSQQGDKTQEK